MKVLFFIHSLGAGGAERVTSHLASFWANRGWRVRVVTLEPLDADHHGLSPSVERVSLGLARGSSSVLAGVRGNLARIRAVRRELRCFEPDVAIGMMSTAAVVLALASIGLRRIIVIGSERVHPPMLRMGAIWERVRRHTYWLLDSVVVLAPESLDWVRDNTRARRVEIIANPVVHPLPHPIAAQRCAGDELPSRARHLLLAMGRLDYQKGFDILINAFARCAQNHPDWDLVVVGEGPQRRELESLITLKSLENRVRLPGRTGRVGEWLERADLYVLSSRFEGFPNTLLEAMAYGVAVVSFDCLTGPKELIRDGQNGLLVGSEDEGELAHAMDRLMRDVLLRERLGSDAKRVRDEYSIVAIANKWEALIQDLGGDGQRS